MKKAKKAAKKIKAKRGPGRPPRITDKQVARARELYATGKYTQVKLAERFACTAKYMGLLVNGIARA